MDAFGKCRASLPVLALVVGLGCAVCVGQETNGGWSTWLDHGGKVAGCIYTVDPAAEGTVQRIEFEMKDKVVLSKGLIRYRNGVIRTAGIVELRNYFEQYGGPHFIWDYWATKRALVSLKPASGKALPYTIKGARVRCISGTGQEYFGRVSKVHHRPDWLQLNIYGALVSFYTPLLRDLQKVR